MERTSSRTLKKISTPVKVTAGHLHRNPPTSRIAFSRCVATHRPYSAYTRRCIAATPRPAPPRSNLAKSVLRNSPYPNVSSVCTWSPIKKSQASTRLSLDAASSSDHGGHQSSIQHLGGNSKTGSHGFRVTLHAIKLFRVPTNEVHWNAKSVLKSRKCTDPQTATFRAQPYLHRGDPGA